MHTDFLLQVISEAGDQHAMIWRDRTYSYNWLASSIGKWISWLDAEGVASGAVTIFRADFSPEAVAGLLALLDRGCIVVPLTKAATSNEHEFTEIAQGEFIITVGDKIGYPPTVARLKNIAVHPLYEALRHTQHPGLVLFSSGSTGRSKGTVHDCTKLLRKYQVRRQKLRTLAFLLFDHIGGFDTMLYTLSNGACLVFVEDRSPDAICQAVQNYGVEVLPVAPTFLNLLAFSEAYKRYTLSSLKYITYGAEVMTEATLRKCTEMFPGVTLLQKYGTTEVGTLRSKSQSSDSLWVKVGGEGYSTRVVEGILQIKANSAMLGYLNAPSPFTEDGWFITGDFVEVNGDYIRILGRKSDLISVGGQKVFPAEIENVIQEMDNIAEVTVNGESNLITGQIVCAKVTLIEPEPLKELTPRLKRFCRDRLEPYKIPVKILVTDALHYGSRLKRMRGQPASAPPQC